MCPRRSPPPRVDAEPVYPAAAKRDILAIASRTLYRATTQLSAPTPVETAEDCGGRGGDAEIDEERELLAAQRPHGKSPPVEWLLCAKCNSGAHSFEERARRTGGAAAQIHEYKFVDE